MNGSDFRRAINGSMSFTTILHLITIAAAIASLGIVWGTTSAHIESMEKRTTMLEEQRSRDHDVWMELKSDVKQISGWIQRQELKK
jgi:hypothetical protein